MMCEICGLDHTIPACRYPMGTLNLSFRLHHGMVEKGGSPMNDEQEYKDKLAVREQLSQFDRLRLLEYEFNLLVAEIHPEEMKRIGLIREAKPQKLSQELTNVRSESNTDK